MLGHKSMNTTVQFYAGQETTNTFRHFDDLIIAQRNEAADPLRSIQSGRGK
jgi:hypothetical protein